MHTRRIPAARAASTTLNIMLIFARASENGSPKNAPARWMMPVTWCRSQTSLSALPSVTSTCSRKTRLPISSASSAFGSGSRRCVNTQLSPSSTKARAVWEPMKPRPPVIRIIVRHLSLYRSARVIVSSADDQRRPYPWSMSSHVVGEVEQTPEQPAAELSNRLGYLLKHANQRLTELTSAALEPFHLNGRELGVLVVLDAMGPTSQQDAARRLGVDRTTMVALIDAL